MKDFSDCRRSFHDRFRESLERAKGPKRDSLTVLATAIWFDEVKRLSGCESYYAMERLFEPEAFRRSEAGAPNHRNKWAKYAVGLHQPSKKLAEKVDQKIPGTAKLLRHPLWEILRDLEAARTKKGMLLFRLDESVQKAVANDCSSWATGKGKGRLSLKRQLKALEKIAGIDSVACMSIMMAEAQSIGRDDDALKIASSLYRGLLITCSFFPFLNFQNEVFTCLCERVFNRVHSNRFRLGIEHVDFPRSTFLLLKLRSELQDSGVIGLKPEDGIEGSAGLLNGKFGLDAQYGLNPPHVLWKESKNISISDKEKADGASKRHEWGISVLMSDRCEKLPPLDLLTGP